MTTRPRPPSAADVLTADTLGTPCPLDMCAASDHPDERCTNVRTADLLRVPHWQRIHAALHPKDQP